MGGVDHLGFIVAAYAVTVVVLGALIGWIVLEGRSLRRQLARLEKRGYGSRRKSGDAG